VTWNGVTTILEQFLAHRPYQAAFLLVHPHIGRLQAALDEIGQQYSWPTLSLSNSLSPLLYPLPPDQRPRQAPRLLADAVYNMATLSTLCDRNGHRDGGCGENWISVNAPKLW
jgi:hypothetical protein